MKKQTPKRTNRWALGALMRRDFKNPSEFAVASEATHSTVFDVLSGRRDASSELLGRMADALDVPVEALSTDPYGVMPALLRLAWAAERHASDVPEVARALEGLREVGL